MEVEALAARCRTPAAPCPFEILEPPGLPLRLSPLPAVRDIVGRLESGRPPEETARAFQDGLAVAAAGLAARLAAEHSVRQVLLSGGCFQNVALLESLGAALEAHGLDWYANREAPVNDGGVALGQVLAAVLTGGE
jgi:hydrogenase maturation protein HypF